MLNLFLNLLRDFAEIAENPEKIVVKLICNIGSARIGIVIRHNGNITGQIAQPEKCLTAKDAARAVIGDDRYFAAAHF
jgi:hypothetical protein